jgi:hypothetical protein
LFAIVKARIGLSPPGRGSKLERRHAQDNVDGNRALEGKRLEREGPGGPADENVDADADAETDIAAHSDIFAGERARAKPEVGANTAQPSTLARASLVRCHLPTLLYRVPAFAEYSLCRMRHELR